MSDPDGPEVGSGGRQQPQAGDETHRLVHRFKNHLQLISSILELQAFSLDSEALRESLTRLQRRVFWIGLLYDLMYRGGEHDEIALGQYLELQYEDLSRRWGGSPVELDVDPVARLDAERALPFALISGELVGNAFEHGRGSGSQEPPEVKVEVDGDRLVLQVADRGPGLPPTFALEECETLGLRLVRLLSQQLGGDLRLSDPPGLVVRLSLPLYPQDP